MSTQPDSPAERAAAEAAALADWRRRVAEAYARWRADAAADAAQATRVFRATRDELFGSHGQSPLPAAARAAHRELAYYDYDPALRLTAVLEPVDEARTPPPALPQSSGAALAFRRIGRVRLAGPLAGQALSVFWMEGYAGGLFLPFRDATSGNETYGAGRYLLDTVKGADLGGDPEGRWLLLDFNMAYHPSCVYDPRWSCPLAPLENRLAVPVRAGERLPAG